MCPFCYEGLSGGDGRVNNPYRKTTRSGGLARYIPILSWLPTYDRAWLFVDVIVWLTRWGLVAPETMAYALSVDLTSATSALIASTVAAVLVASAAAALGSSDPDTYQNYASALVLVVGVVFLVAGLARLGLITQFLLLPRLSKKIPAWWCFSATSCSAACST